MRPAIVWVHGGSFKSGDKSSSLIVNEATVFAKLGYVGASISGAKKLGVADAGDASSLLLHGTADTVVPYQWAVDTYNEATAAQLTTYLTSFDGAGHAPYRDYGTEMFEQTRNFLYWEMDLSAAAH